MARGIIGEATILNRTVVLLLALVLLVGFPTHGAAHFREHRDANDARGKLDIRRAGLDAFNLSSSSAQVMVEIRTFRRYELDSFSGFIASFDSKGSRRLDFYARIRKSAVSGIYCEVYKRRNRYIGEGEATRGPRSVFCSFNRRWLDHDGTHMRWNVRSFNGGIADYVPNRGWFLH